MEQLFSAGKAYLKINSLVKTPLHEFMAVERSGLWAPAQAHEPPDDALIRSLQLTTRRERDVRLDNKLEDLRNSLPVKSKRAVDLAPETGAPSWLTVIPVKEIDLNLNKREFKDAVHLRYDWQINDVPNVCICGEPFNVDHAMICKRGVGLHYTTS